MTTIRTFAVVRKMDGTLDARDAYITVDFADGKGISVGGLDDDSVRDIMLRTIKALNATGFLFLNKRIFIRFHTMEEIGADEYLLTELLDLPLAVAFMQERMFAKFDTSVRYIGELCADGRVMELDGFVIRACRLRWPPNFVSSLSYPNGGIRRDPGHTYLREIMRDIDR